MQQKGGDVACKGMLRCLLHFPAFETVILHIVPLLQEL